MTLRKEISVPNNRELWMLIGLHNAMALSDGLRLGQKTSDFWSLASEGPNSGVYDLIKRPIEDHFDT